MFAKIWGPAGPTDSIAKQARTEVRAHLKRNGVARRARYSRGHRLLRILLTATFGILLARYLLIDLAMINLEGFRQFFPRDLFVLSEQNDAGARSLIEQLPPLFLAAQVGLLTIISLALALVTLIAQREDATTDIKVYYHESMFFGMAASGLALVVVLVTQLFWPLQSLYRLLAGNSPSAIFDFLLLTAHALWLVINLIGAAHFVAVTFEFVQPSARKRLRERYTANAAMPEQLAATLRQHIYLGADSGFNKTEPHAVFGSMFRATGTTEIERDFGDGSHLVDVHLRLVRWVIKRWSARCKSSARAPNGNTGPRLIFAPVPGRKLSGEVVWCLRDGGVPLSSFEKRILGWAFRFDEDARDA